MFSSMHAAFDFIIGSKELLAAILTAVLSSIGFLIVRLTAAKAKLHHATVHSAHLLPKNDQGAQFSVFTADYYFRNAGRKVCDSVEFVFNFPPQHFEIFPHLPYTTHLNPDDRLVVKIDNLNPGESFRIRMLNSISELPQITNVRFRGGSGKEIKLEQQRYFSRKVKIGVAIIMLMGILALIYIPLRIAQLIF